MKERSLWEKYGYPYLITSVCLVSGITMINYYGGLLVWEPWVVVLTLAVAALSMVICHYWKQVLITILALFGAGVLFTVVGALLWSGSRYFGSEAISSFFEAAATGRWWEVLRLRVTQVFENPNMKLIGAGLAAGSSFYLIQKRYAGRLALAAVMLVWLVASSLLYWKVPKAAAAMGTAGIFMVLSEAFLCGRLFHHSGADKKAMSWLAPVFVIAALLLFNMPVSEKPVQWTWVKQGWQRVKDMGESVYAHLYSLSHSGELEFRITYTGFSGSGRVSGDLKSSHNDALRVEALQGQPRTMYLAGTVKNVYTSSGWERDMELDSGAYEEYRLDLAEFLYALNRNQTLEEKDGVAALRKVRISYDGIYTKTLFYPLKTGIIHPEDERKYKSSGEELSFLKLPRRGVYYDTYYMEPNYASRYMEELLERQEGYEYGSQSSQEEEASWYRAVEKAYPQLKLSEISGLDQALLERSERISKEYTALPERVPDRIYQLAAALTEGEDSDYKKIKRIEAFLGRYEYSLTPGEVPADRDVVDYFLFESGQGYCTYFASALAVLGRAAGVPTRYVQGFMISMPEEAVSVSITDAGAHAWVEAYIQGVGWLPFEASTGFSQYRYQPWAVAGEPLAATPSTAQYPEDTNPNELESGDPYSLVWEQLESEDAALWEQLEAVERGHNPEDDWLLEPVPEEKPKINLTPYYLAMLIMIFALVMLSLLYRIAKRSRRYRRSDCQDKVRMDMEALFAIWTLDGKPIKPGETFLDYIERLGRTYPGERVALNRIAGMYMDIRYGRGQATEKAEQMVRALRKAWLSRLKKARAWGKYLRALKRIYL